MQTRASSSSGGPSCSFASQETSIDRDIDRLIKHLRLGDIGAIDIVGPQPKNCSTHEEPAAIVLKIKDATVSCRFLGRGILRYVREISKKYVF